MATSKQVRKEYTLPNGSTVLAEDHYEKPSWENDPRPRLYYIGVEPLTGGKWRFDVGQEVFYVGQNAKIHEVTITKRNFILWDAYWPGQCGVAQGYNGSRDTYYSAYEPATGKTFKRILAYRMANTYTEAAIIAESTRLQIKIRAASKAGPLAFNEERAEWVQEYYDRLRELSKQLVELRSSAKQGKEQC